MAQYNNAINNTDYNTPVTLSGAANVTALLSDYIIGVDDTAAPRTVTLPAASTVGANANSGKVYIIKDQSGGAGTNNITVSPASGTIDGGASLVISSDYGELVVYSDGAAWYSGSPIPIGLPIGVPQGGTGASTLTDGGIVLGSGVNPVTVTAQPTDGQLLIGATGADPVLASLTSAGASLTVTGGTGTVSVDINAPVSVANGGTGATSLTDGGVMLGSGTGAVTVTGQPTNGQVLIGSSGNDPVFSTLTAGAGITITDAAGSITLASTGVVWSLQATGTPLLPNEGFLSSAATAQNFALPTSGCAVGCIVELAQNGAGLVTITQAAGQSIRFGNLVSTVGVGGSVASSAQGDAVKLVCTVANTSYQAVTGSLGNWTVV